MSGIRRADQVGVVVGEEEVMYSRQRKQDERSHRTVMVSAIFTVRELNIWSDVTGTGAGAVGGAAPRALNDVMKAVSQSPGSPTVPLPRTLGCQDDGPPCQVENHCPH